MKMLPVKRKNPLGDFYFEDGCHDTTPRHTKKRVTLGRPHDFLSSWKQICSTLQRQAVFFKLATLVFEYNFLNLASFNKGVTSGSNSFCIVFKKTCLVLVYLKIPIFCLKWYSCDVERRGEAPSYPVATMTQDRGEPVFQQIDHIMYGYFLLKWIIRRLIFFNLKKLLWLGAIHIGAIIYVPIK